MYLLKLSLVLCCCLLASSTAAQPVFKLIPLGVLGGADESNLSAYMLAPATSNNFICLDAGTLHAGIAKAVAKKTLTGTPEQVLKKNIKGYLISHSHLDHLAGLVINSPDDTAKNIYAFEDCIKTFQNRYFTWNSWANFADAGEAPQLKKYHYVTLEPGQEIPLAGTEMTVKAFALSHSNLVSTAFLVGYKDRYVLYLGDTGPDAVEKSTKLHELWEAIAPLIKNRSLKAIMIETSFPDEQPDKSLFGHFTPKWLMTEFDNLSKLTGADALKGFKVLITHRKPPQKNIRKIELQLMEENKFGLHIVYPRQGQSMMIF